MPSVLLPVPHFEQSRDGACLPACARMVLAHWGDLRSETEISRILGTRAFGTPISRIRNLADWGYDVALVYRVQRSALQDYLDTALPVIARVWTAMLDYWQHDSSHVCVLVGYDDDCVIVNDPALSEGYRRVAWDAFLAAWAEFDETAIVVRPMRG